MKTAYDVTGMHCQSCSRKLRESLLASPHVSTADVSLSDHRVVVEGDEQLSLAELNIRAAEAGDYHLAPADAVVAVGAADNSSPQANTSHNHNGSNHNGSNSAGSAIDPDTEFASGVKHEPDRSRFAYAHEGRASVLSYERPDDKSIDLKHTFVPPADRGEGIGAKLADSALSYAEANQLRVVPTCSYVRHYLEENPRYQSLTNGKSGRDDDRHDNSASGGHDHSSHGGSHAESGHEHGAQQDRSWLATYKPLLLIVGYLVGGTAIAGAASGVWSAMFLMSVFMGLFFVTFSLFKMLDLAGFAEAYTSYDLVAARWLPYAYVYPFIELGLGVAYLLQVAPVAVNIVTLIVMLLSTAGVVNAVSRGRDIQCGCLGTAFDLPMSTLTIVEDATMAIMAAGMLVILLD